MPVTKCEPETTRKASRKSVKTQETVLSALLAQTEEVSVPLASLIKSPLNVRTVPYSAESVSELAGSIQGVGLLQNLVVHTLPGERYGVAAGGRRLAALNMLAERGIIPADWPVRVKIIPQELATAASMTENGHRRDMHPAEQIAGFRAMAQEGKTPAHIGDLLGYSPRHVQRMLKLADLAPVILDALAEDRITTEHCQALALENDTARQVQVFEAACQSGWGGKPEVQTIRRLVTESEVAVAGNSKFRFVGADAFSPDELRTDLFSDDGDGYVDRVALDAALLEKLKNFLEDMQWEGFANMDIKYDARTGEYKMFEMNPRQGRSSYFVTAAGYNLSKWLVEDVLEHKELGLTIADTKSLWMIAPYGVIKKYLKDPDLLARADKLKKEGKCAHQLFCKEDWNLKRWLWYIRSQLNYYRKTARYYGNKGLRD